MRHLLLIFSLIVAGCGKVVPLPFNESGELVILTRVGSTTYSPDSPNTLPGSGNDAMGFEHDLVQMFAADLKSRSRFVVAASDDEVQTRLRNGEAHMAAAWLVAPDDHGLPASTPFFESRNILVTHEASLPPMEIRQLAHKSIHVVAGSRQETALRKISDEVPGLKAVASRQQTEIDLMERVASQRIEAALVNNAEFDIGINHFPVLQNAMQIGPSRPIVWLFAPNTDPALIAKANDFLERSRKNGELDRLKDRYFGHVNRLTQADTLHFIERVQSVLPRFRKMFQDAQTETGIDWRILAAVSYQESQWEPLATSPTGVRGIMMLTEETADQLNVCNRLDPAESIRAGARYISSLRQSLPPGISEPDRLWLALAAYNLGMGHLKAAMHIAGTLNADPNSWYEMKKVLPLLAQPKYYNRLKSGRGRGGEAVIMVENIRVYTDILTRREMAFSSIDIAPETRTDKSGKPRKLFAANR
ncbi:membrane-bound lytic murein transglycosylase MltF [Propionivibrio limicola]|uniref:membrane-bound lytic murein transglycosylase MltF n=1 Tax=Propionivibrio limicola TaxID=167645 RepID=UPI00129235DF|nr:membrane-bound lytic murein transglycosylase MltF [Propionivibrio limicola]